MKMNETKTKSVQAVKQHAQDTGSVEVQIAALTHDIESLATHFKNFPKDYNSKRGLLKKVAQRKAFLNYLRKRDEAAYKKIIETCKIRG